MFDKPILSPTGMGTEVAEGKQVITVGDRSYLLELPLRADVAIIKASVGELVVTDLGLFEVRDGRFLLRECLGPDPPDWILERTDADFKVAEGAWPP